MHVGQRDLAALFGGNETAQALTLGFAPAFPPAGREIVYTPATGRKPTQWEIRADGAGRIRLGQGSGADEARPAVSPDGSLVVYESVLRHRSRLFAAIRWYRRYGAAL